jgi:hypothetical protein
MQQISSSVFKKIHGPMGSTWITNTPWPSVIAPNQVISFPLNCWIRKKIVELLDPKEDCLIVDPKESNPFLEKIR